MNTTEYVYNAKFTDEEEENIREELRNGANVPTLAKKHNVHKNTIYNIRNRQGHKGKYRPKPYKVTPELTERLIELYVEQKKGAPTISKEVGLSSQHILKVLKANGVEIRDKPGRGRTGKFITCSLPGCERQRWVQPNQIDRGEDKYCSKECANKGNVVRTTFTCDNPPCTRQFTRTPSELAKNKSGLHYCGKDCWGEARNPNGTVAKKDGYVLVRVKDHPVSKQPWFEPLRRKSGWIAEHILVMELHRERHLTEYESVHHKNGVKNDNRIENLELRERYHGKGQEIEDKVEDALRILDFYRPEVLDHSVLLYEREEAA